MPAPRAKAICALIDADAAVLHIKDDEFGAGIGRDLTEARREELGGNDAISGAAAFQTVTNGIGAHDRLNLRAFDAERRRGGCYLAPGLLVDCHSRDFAILPGLFLYF